MLRLVTALLLFAAWSARSQPLVISTKAGDPGGRSTNGVTTNARFNAPGGVAVDGSGNAYVADSASHTIRRIASDGTASVFAGLSGSSGSANGTGGNARFNQPQGVAVDASGNVYVADTGNHTIRKITSGGVVSTFAGIAGSPGSADATGTNAQFYAPVAVSVKSDGSLIYVADTYNHTVRQITAAGVVTTLAGKAGVFGFTNAVGSAAAFYQPQGIAVDGTGNVFVGDTANNSIRMVTSGGSVTTLAGTTNSGSADGTSAARFNQPMGVAVDAPGNVYVADNANHTLRMVTSGGSVSTLAGSAGLYGSVDGTAGAARFYAPQGVAVSGTIVYVADTGNGTIRRVASSGAVTNWVGSASIGTADGAGASARFYWPGASAMDTAGNIFVADTFNHTIRKITSGGTVSTLAGSPGNPGTNNGSGGGAQFNGPEGIALDGGGNLYVADTGNHTIRMVTSGGTVSTVAGTAGVAGLTDGTGSGAQFNGPQGIAVDGSGNLFVADTASHTIRKIASGGVVTTLAGIPLFPGSTDGATPNVGTNKARFNFPRGIAVDGAGNAYVADTGNHLVRKVTSAGAVSTLAGLAGVWGIADGTNSTARFNSPRSVAVDGSGIVYVLDAGNHTVRSLAASGSNWITATIAGNPSVNGITDGAGSGARFNYPKGLAVNSTGNFAIADGGNNTIRAGISSANIAPVIVTQPQDQVVGQGQPSTFVVVAAGAMPLNYQWKFNSATIAGATGSSYSIVSSQPSNAGPYSVVISNSLGVTPSSNATLAVIIAPAITNSPQSMTAVRGSNATFTVGASGTPPLAYQWNLNGSTIAGASGNTLLFTNVQDSDAGDYTVVVSNPAGSVTSSPPATLTVVALPTPPGIITQPQSVTAIAGSSATFSVSVIGDLPLSFQWRFQNSDIAGATDSAFVIPGVSSVNAGAYSVFITNVFGSVLSSNAYLAIVSAIAVGDNEFGQLDIPFAATNGVAIAAGSWHSLFLNASGNVLAWGNNYYGQCTLPPGLSNIIAIAAGGYHSLAVPADGSVLGWGNNEHGQTNAPFGLRGVVAIAAGAAHSLALRSDGTVIAWGDNTDGQTNIPAGLAGVTAIAAAGNHSLALKTNGIVVAWGENTDADGHFAGQSVVPWNLSNVVGIAAGDYHSLAVCADGSVVCWGDDSEGQCDVPAGLSNVALIAGGSAHSLALKRDGSATAWGANWDGRCDLPSALTNVAAVAGGAADSLLMVTDGAPKANLLFPRWTGSAFSAWQQTLARQNYALEFKSDLTQSNWISLPGVSGNGAVQLLKDSSATNAPRYYRGRQW